MGPVVVDHFQVLESSMFNRVLNIYVANTTTDFVAATLSLLGTDQLCDFAVALLRKPANGSFVAYHSDHRAWDLSFVQRQAELLRSIRSHADAHQKLLVAQASGDSAIHESLDHYRGEILEKIGSAHTVLLFFGEHTDPLSLLISVHRAFGSRDFDPLELARLETFRRYIENAWALLTQRLLSRVLIDGISLALRNYDRGVVMLDSAFRVVWHNRAARASILEWNADGRSELKPSRHLAPLPKEILAACEKLRNEWLESPSLGRLRTSHVVHHPTKRGQHATVRLHGVRFTGITSPNFVVQFESHPTASVPGKNSIMLSLTSAEREVAHLVRQGMSNQEIADALGKSVDAVKFHLHRMFKKADVTTRSRLMLVLT